MNVHVVGIGQVSAIGNSVQEALHSLQHDVSGIGALTLFQSAHGHLPVGEVKLSNRLLAERINVNPNLPRAALLGILSAREAV